MTKRVKLVAILTAARQAAVQLAKLDTQQKNEALAHLAGSLRDNKDKILAENFRKLFQGMWKDKE